MLCHAMPHGPHHRTINTADHHDEAMNALAHRHCATSTHTHTHTVRGSFFYYTLRRTSYYMYIYSLAKSWANFNSHVCTDTACIPRASPRRCCCRVYDARSETATTHTQTHTHDRLRPSARRQRHHHRAFASSSSRMGRAAIYLF